MKLELVHLGEVASTSTHVAELLAGGKRPPFAVLAGTQTGGRGRRGNDWASPEGNVYLTLALPPPVEPLDQHGLLPLKAGVLVSRFLTERLGLRITLKWPNDLLFEGQKLGGLLLEGSTANGKAGAVLVGLGLNVKVAPTIAQGEYQTTSLERILGKTLDAGSLGVELAEMLANAWSKLSLAGVVDAYKAAGLAEGHLFVDGGSYRRLAGILADGRLRLAANGGLPAGGASLELSSADHGWRWVHQAAAPLVVADAGNSALKLAVFQPAAAAEPAWTRAIHWQDLARELPGALAEIAKLVPATPWPLFLLSVHPPGANEVERLATASGFGVELLAKRPVRRHGDGYALASLGIDRLAALEGWLRAAPKNVGAVVVSAGTATTVDVVRPDGSHAGGFILAGLGLGLKALHESASLLPALDPATESMPAFAALGSETRGAMLGGALLAAVASVQNVAARFPGYQIVLTGGHAAALSRCLPEARVEPNLVLSGARVLAL